LFSSQFNFPVNSLFKTRETSIAPLTPSRNVLSFSFRSPAERCAMRIVPLVKAASSAPHIVAEVDGSRDEPRRKKLAVFVSGGGSNFRKIHEGCSDGSVNGDVVLLVTNKKGITFLLLLLQVIDFGLLCCNSSFSLCWFLELMNQKRTANR